MNEEMKQLLEEVKQDALESTEAFAKKLAEKAPRALQRQLMMLLLLL
jgi:hypothetical protein